MTEHDLVNPKPAVETPDDPSWTPDEPSWRATYLGSDTHDGSPTVSWGSVFAGVVTFLAFLVAFGLLGAAIGLGVVEPASDQPFEGVGTGLAIWAVATLIISLSAAGFVAGVLAVRGGFMHGVVTWGASLIALVVMLGMLASSLFGAIGSVVSGAASAVGGGVASVADLAGDGVQAAVDGVGDAVGDVDLTGLDGDVEQILADTGVPELQPAHLQDQVDQSVDEIIEAGRAILVAPEDAEAILDDLASSLEERATTIGDAVDRDAIAQSVEANTDLTGAEAEEAVDTVEQAWQETAATAREQIANAETALEDARLAIDEAIDDARQAAQEASDAAARAAGWAFAGVVLGLAITAFAALVGSRLVISRDTGGRVDNRI